MKKTIVTRVLTIATAAVMFAGTLTAGVAAAPAIRVEAADASFTQTLLSAFDSQFYASKYADVKKAYGNDADALFAHFLNNGMKEGRMINANFDPKAYIQAYSDVKTYCNGSYTKAYEHYYKIGRSEGRNLTTFAAIDAQKNAAKAQKELQKKVVKNLPVYRDINIGYGITLSLSNKQLDSCIVYVFESDYGYGAYINESLVATSGFYNQDNAILHSTIVFDDGNMNEYINNSPSYSDDDVADALALGLVLYALSEEANA
ncbi:MAG: hypothetical protein K6E91_03530 [Butyrivibrio sp.]|nr:hypothetical protein [Butyrivibrio sp.]